MSGIPRYGYGFTLASHEEGLYVTYVDHAAEIARLQSLSDAAIEGYERTTSKYSDTADKYIEAKQEIARLRAEADALRKVIGEVTQCLADTVNEVGGWAIEEVIEAGMTAAMGADA